MHSIPVVPDFESFSLVLVLAVGGVTALAMVLLVRQSRADFSTAGDVLRHGRLKRQGFYPVLAAQFAVAAAFVLWLDGRDYVSGDLPAGHGGIAAYLDPEKSPDDIRLSRILACDWSDRFRLSALLDGEATDTRALPTTETAQEFREFAKAMERNFQIQAPFAVQSLTERLNPVFLMLGGLFMVSARSLVRQGSEDATFPPRALIESAVLALCFVFLAYFAILAYHSATEVARAFAAGRVVCTSHIAPFFIAQSQALSISAICLLLLFVVSPRPIFRSL